MPETTTPADEIRAAAKKLRSLATGAAHEDRTRWEVGHTLGSKSRVVVDNHERPTVLIETWAAHREQVDDYLAAFASPAVGLGVAQWLEQTAREIADCGGFAAGAVDGPMNDRDHNAWSAALTVARAITAV
ncbi:hypothetical protein [Streptomyces sp. NBC_01268]|uniref:hypothetical protein n=1 Tax=Streptomyces sp. NBC_01268 TaxID=2903806 RepID=UPI002E315236|nr:hypothetical protein [Streptomyces sp. NBC_01268]